MKVTSNEANKLLKTYVEKLNRLKSIEEQSATYVLATTERADDKPTYDIYKTQKEILVVNENIRKIKHAINVFNVNTIVPDTCNLTIDEVLVYMPQLNEMVSKLSAMKNALPKVRKNSVYNKSNIIEYQYANYEIDEAVSLHEKYQRELIHLQTSLDTINNTVKFEIDI